MDGFKKIILILEPLIITLTMGIVAISPQVDFRIPTGDRLIDFAILILFALMVFSRSPSPRFYWYGCILLVITALASIFNFTDASSFSSALTLGVFIVAYINQLLFKNHAPE